MTTLEELREEAAELDIPGRSTMNKDELEAAVLEARAAAEQDEGSAVSEEEQEALEQASDEAAAEVENEGETGTPVSDASSDDASSSPTGRGVGFRR